MIDLEPQEAELLGRAQRALSPGPADRERVLAALGPQLAGVAAAPGLAGGKRFTGWWRVGGGLLAAGVAVVAGYDWGYRAGRAARPAPVVASPRPAALPVSDAPSALVASATVRDPTPAPKSERAATSKAAPSAAVSGAESLEAAAGLDEEVRQLRRIERAIRDGNPRLALAIGENLDQAIPRGQLLLERRAAQLMASCQLDSSAGSAPARHFLEQNPQSPYAPRLRELCGAEPLPQRNDVLPGTNDAEREGNK